MKKISFLLLSYIVFFTVYSSSFKEISDKIDSAEMPTDKEFSILKNYLLIMNPNSSHKDILKVFPMLMKTPPLLLGEIILRLRLNLPLL